MSRIEILTPAQSALMAKYRDKWIAIGLSTARADRAQAEAGIIKAYSIANLAPPKIVWCDSPLANALTREIVKKASKEIGASVGDSVGDSVWDSLYGQHDASWLGFYDYFRGVCGLVAQTEKLDGSWMIAKNAGWFLPHRGICWVSERHNICKLKDGRIHSEAGPAIAYPDGFSIYALNGVRVPDWLVDTRVADLDPARLMKIDNAEVRREFVRKVGPERIVQVLSPGALDKRTYTTCDGREHPYELHRFNTPGGPWTYLRMVNPSVGLVHFEGVPNECRTVQEALNFRNRIRPEQVSDDGADWKQQGDVLLKPAGATKFKPFPSYLS